MNRTGKCVGLTVLGVAALVIGAAGCSSNEDTREPFSGNPEADRRADMRVGGGDGDDRGRDTRTLYERLGGADAIHAIVEDLTERSLADPRVNFERKDVKRNWLGDKYKAWDPTPANIDHFKQHMREFLTLASGGPAEYTGRELKPVHKGMKITNNEVDAMVGDIKTSMDKLGFGPREKRDRLAIIETTRKEIVEE